MDFTDDASSIESSTHTSPLQPGFVTFYGLYWRKKCVIWDDRQMLGSPSGWTGKGRQSKEFDKSKLQMNFWNQKGVYILYNSDMTPVYAGQAGLTRSGAGEGGGTIGGRLGGHRRGIYRNGWELFTWFGFLSTPQLSLKSADEKQRMNPEWTFSVSADQELNKLLASFEAILIEGFAPRFNSRGGDLKGAKLVDQFDTDLL